jgi:hypothetical protein
VINPLLKKRLSRRKGMTVCVAAIAEKRLLIGASDRMLTAGDIEFEPEQAKVWIISNSIFALIAGDGSIQAEIMKEVHKDIQHRIVAFPTKWVSVKDVATLYCEKYRDILRNRAETEVLKPLGLDFQQFIQKQSEMQREFVADIADKLISYQFGTDLETIFMGLDNDGPPGLKGELLVYPQIYTTYCDKISCLTTVGFAAIRPRPSPRRIAFDVLRTLGNETIRRDVDPSLCSQKKSRGGPRS